ncbi:hypothetical protein DDZ14_04030 [Maritimibacter sp. 55A14]|uniref:DUF2189 domain-containing protein n=1 Tax=Maritimibacter sp. 55A14 TaxID=2174844 RepID=UPI000D615EFF|nr:DUF2189 domain-containing protein [Maritimibacter sp. 55A14]PWE33836.1 hypothetical protein DDZ14_04030 [Maritimibacter sp. 55A14]
MVRTIGNPGSWLFNAFGGASAHAAAAASELAAEENSAPPQLRDITLDDLRAALRAGVEDFTAFRTDVFFLVLLYPLMGLLLVWFAFDRNMMPLIFPLVSGFALIGPVAGIGLYEMSRRRELGLETGWADAFAVLRSPSLGPILVLGLYLLALFIIWIVTAGWIHSATMGPEIPVSITVFLREVLTTGPGWAMIVIGTGVGFLFAASVLAVSVISFPLLIDRHVGLPVAVATSIRLTRRNPVTVAAWGLIVAVSLALGSLPLLLGLVLVLPILGHATWHLYRRAVEPAPRVTPS